MAADALATQVARASTAMVLTMCVDSEFLVFNKERFQPPVPSHILRNDTKLCAENMVKYIHKKGYWNCRYGEVQMTTDWKYSIKVAYSFLLSNGFIFKTCIQYLW